jgi:hypothetical protein
MTTLNEVLAFIDDHLLDFATERQTDGTAPDSVASAAMADGTLRP